MSTHVVLLRDKKDAYQYQKYLNVFLACRKAFVKLPKEVDDYFGGAGLGNDPEYPLEIKFEPRKWADEHGSSGYEIDIDELPENVKIIRFFNSW
jgi:hypothetical protein